MRIQPGQDIARALKNGATLELTEGNYRGGGVIAGMSGFTLVMSGAVLEGGANGLKFVNCHDFHVIGGVASGAGSYGFFLEKCQRFSFTGTSALNAGTTGFLTTNIVDGSFLRCTGRGSRDQWGIYISERAAKVRIVGGEYSQNGRGAVQINCDKGGATDVEIRDLLAVHNQDHPGSHAAAIQVGYVRGGRVLNCDIRDHCGRHGITVVWGSKDITVDQNRFEFASGYGEACVFVDRKSKANVGPLNQYARNAKAVLQG